MKKLKFDYDHSPRKKGEVVEFTTRQELKIADFYLNAGIAHEVCEDCKKGKEGCEDCGDTTIKRSEETKEVKKRTARKKKVDADNN